MSEHFRLCEAARNFLRQPKQLLIAGKWQSALSGKSFGTENPATGDSLVQIAHGEKADIDLAVRAARQAFESGPWSNMPANERSHLLWKLADLIDKHAEELAQLETLDNGKPISEAKNADIPGSAETFRYMAGWATKIYGETFPISTAARPHSAFFNYTLKEPVGVVGQIIPWNFPLLMAAWKLAPALATGCTVVLKPAEQTPLTALRLGELILEAGFPAGVVNIITGFGDAGAALAAHPGVDKVAFTGSTEVGKSILTAAQGNLKKVSLELGGKSPHIIFADADLDQAIRGAASGIFFNQGQVCCAGSRLFIERSVYSEVLDGLNAIAKNIRLGDGLDPQTQMGPLVSQQQCERVSSYLEEGQRAGAKIFTGGKKRGDKGYFIEPTIFTHVTEEMKIVREEIFGPVVVAQSFTDLREVLRSANDSNYGLASGVWTKNLNKAHQVSAALKAGTVWVNCYNVFDPSMPFGGYKESGWGREGGKDVLDLYLQTKSVCMLY